MLKTVFQIEQRIFKGIFVNYDVIKLIYHVVNYDKIIF